VGPTLSAQADNGGSASPSRGGKNRRRKPGQDTVPIGWFGNRERIRPGNGIQVIRFQVWQDLSGPCKGNVAPLHATVTFEMSNEWYSSLTTPDGIIRIELAEGNEVIEARLVLHQAHHDLDPAQLKSNRRLQFVVSPTPLHSELDAERSVRGVAKMKFWNRKVTIRLPETRLAFVR
jgi:hypothetical protein